MLEHRSPKNVKCVPVFAALGDEIRISLIDKLVSNGKRSISQLADGSGVSRQAITRHLQVLEGAGLVRNFRSGRESLYLFNQEAFEEIRAYLDSVSEQWNQALLRLKLFVESP